MVGAGLAFVVLAGLAVPRASAVILSPTTIDGPSTEGLSLGGAAMASDGTGGLVYTKAAEGMDHVFASRYDGSSWSAPMRVDGELSLPGSQPRIAAGENGRLLVVWVAPVATLARGGIRFGLYSATLGAGAREFSSPLLVDANVGEGVGVDPSVAGTTPGNAIVAYRVVTDTFPKPPPAIDPNVQLREGDVMAEIRAARLEGGRWSKLPALNRNAAASMRAPTEANAPQVAIGATGRAVVAWQEPDLSGAARILMRRIAGTTPGPVFLASPESWNGKPITEDATAFSLGVTAFDQARLAFRVEGGAGSALGTPRVFLTTLGPSTTPAGAKPTGPETADGPGGQSAPIGPPAVSATTGRGTEGSMRLAFSSGSAVRLVGITEQGKVLEPETVQGPPAEPGTPAVVTVGPEGGDVVAYEAVGEGGIPAVGVSQVTAEGSRQTGLLYGPIGGPISQLTGAGSGAGDALFAFRQGEAGQFAIVADRVAATPGAFSLHVPERWVAPKQAKVTWGVPPGAVGELSYGLLLNGRTISTGLEGHSFTPPPSKLYSGIGKVQVVATDRFGEEVLSKPAKMRVDSQPPRLQVHLLRKRDAVRIKLLDRQSGLRRKATRVFFGDGARRRHGAVFTHRYAVGGNYRIRLRAEDKVGNSLVQRLRVKVR
jgi:hypothetical protein